MRAVVLGSFLLTLLLSAPVRAENRYEHLSFRGVEFKPALHLVEGKTVLNLQDPEVQRLISHSTAQLQWSSTGNTLYVFSPGKESFWTNGWETLTVNKAEIPAPGMLIVNEHGSFMEPAALYYALSLRGFPGKGGPTILLPVVNAVVAEPQSGALEVKVSAPVKPDFQVLGDGTARMKLQDVAWDAPQRDFFLGDVRILANGGTAPGQALTIDFKFPRNWEGALRSGGLLNGLGVVAQPAFPTSSYAPRIALKSVGHRDHGKSRLTLLELDRPCQFFWSFDRESRRLRVELPNVDGSVDPQALSGSAIEDLRVTVLRTSPYPVLRLEGTLPPGKNCQFFEIKEMPRTLALGVGPADLVGLLEAEGGASTSGYQAYNGTIVIDPGHGGSDPGCVNRRLGVMEKDVTLSISLKLAEVLRAQGWNVVLTRTSDRDVTYAGSPDKEELMARSDVANQIDADLFISIHCNASVSSYHCGSSIHWYKAEDYDLARSLEHVLGDTVGFAQKGLHRNRFVVLRYANMPAVLVETAYLTNPREGSMLSDPEFQNTIAAQLAGGLASYMEGRYAAIGGGPELR